MSAIPVLALYTMKECTRRKVFIVVPIITFAFLILYGIGNHYAFHFSEGTFQQSSGVFVDADAFTGATLVGLSMFVTLFLASVLGVFLTFSTVRGDAEQGLLQPVLVRPLSRTTLLLGRFLGTIAVCVTFALLLYFASVVITGVTGGWWPDPVAWPGIEIAAGVVVVTAISLFGSIYLSLITNGIAVFMIYGAGLLAGLLGQIGSALSLDTLETVGKVASWALPFEALYQAALGSLTANTTGLTRVIVQLGPLGGAQSGGPLLALWFLAYLAALGLLGRFFFGRRDL